MKARPPNFHLHSIEIWRIISGNEVAKTPACGSVRKGRSFRVGVFVVTGPGQTSRHLQRSPARELPALSGVTMGHFLLNRLLPLPRSNSLNGSGPNSRAGRKTHSRGVAFLLPVQIELYPCFCSVSDSGSRCIIMRDQAKIAAGATNSLLRPTYSCIQPLLRPQGHSQSARIGWSRLCTAFQGGRFCCDWAWTNKPPSTTEPSAGVAREPSR